MWKHLTIGKRRIYTRLRNKCNFSFQPQRACTEERNTVAANSEIATHLLEDAVFEIVREHMLDP